MSYCRFSSDDWKSDVYSFESSEGFETYVAGHRIVGDIPLLKDILTTPPEEWVESYQQQMAALETAERQEIDLPHAGGKFFDNTLQELLDRLLWLRGLGYHVPESALNLIRIEILEEANEANT